VDVKIEVNGKTREFRDGGTVIALLNQLGADCARVAIVVNDQVIARADRRKMRLKLGDRVEILTYAGGG
jgi:thiamine biosynthesis protein ThiS